LKKIEKMYNTQFYNEESNKDNPSSVLKNLGIYDKANNIQNSQKTEISSDFDLLSYLSKPYKAKKPESSGKGFYDYYKGNENNMQNITLNSDVEEEETDNYESEFNFNSNADENSLGNMDVTTELPKLSAEQIKNIISTYFSKSTVITPSDAEGIYKAQQNTGMSALAILGIGALESGYGTSNIAKKKGNIWGWGATNKNPMGNAKSFSQMSQGASEFANAFLKTYYNGYGAKSINSAGTGNNPSKKGYAYNDNGTIDASWATKVGNIMKKFYQTAKNTTSNTNQNTTSNTNQSTNSNLSNKVGSKIANVSGYNNSAAKGQCVWYVRGRMKQKLGKETGALGNGNQMWYNAKKSARLAPIATNIKPNTIASYKTGLSSAGKKYGHVIYIEDVVGDTVYYTEGGSYYYNNGTIGTLKKASTKEILNGSSKFGYGLIGFIDAENY
ncbi:MAG: glucosaminidase domain-containing protein, partial [Acutalibacteraceae bacterium]|nr:glucosaminidase domain-containing protein [Acutalibacteraceae bacterium]